ncbi:MAG TPA: cytochrome P450, partial [Ilumatobacteraceae bacterium]|nr:cytochrome P450 [Ilumatobacteraceae bacterium]
MSDEPMHEMLPTNPPGMPATDLDLWSDEVLSDPYPAYRQLRDIGPVVWLNRYGIAAFPRFAEVRSALARWQDFTSAQGVSSSSIANTAIPPNITSTDPPEHDVWRAPLAAQLSVASLTAEAATMADTARHLIDGVLAMGSFDAVADLARPFSLTVVSDLVGIPEAERDVFPELAESAFNVMGATNGRTGSGMKAFGEIAERCMRMAGSGTLCPGRRGVELVEAGQPLLLISYTWPGVDTTVNALASAMYLFATHPEQWEIVRNDRSSIPGAFAEVLRLHAPVQHFTRVATSDQDVDGVVVPAGTRVLMMYGSANRDERQYPDSDGFDVKRPNADHLTFGRGVHLCVGHNLAKLEGQTLFAELADRVERFELTGEPEWIINNTLHGLARLPVRA